MRPLSSVSNRGGPGSSSCVRRGSRARPVQNRASGDRGGSGHGAASGHRCPAARPRDGRAHARRCSAAVCRRDGARLCGTQAELRADSALRGRLRERTRDDGSARLARGADLRQFARHAGRDVRRPRCRGAGGGDQSGLHGARALAHPRRRRGPDRGRRRRGRRRGRAAVRGAGRRARRARRRGERASRGGAQPRRLEGRCSARASRAAAGTGRPGRAAVHGRYHGPAQGGEHHAPPDGGEHLAARGRAADACGRRARPVRDAAVPRLCRGDGPAPRGLLPRHAGRHAALQARGRARTDRA